MPLWLPDRPATVAAADAAVTAVTSCPFCKSSRVTTTSKTVSAATYWRCDGCGEIWNPGRAASSAGFGRMRW